MEDIGVGDSQIAGKGIFAKRDFKQGDVINIWSGKILSKKEFEALSEDEKIFCSKYSDNEWMLFDEPDKYFNHSCNPNTVPGDHCEIAKRDIKNGEELTVDYDAEEAAGEPFTCKCGSVSCRQIIRNNSKKKI